MNRIENDEVKTIKQFIIMLVIVVIVALGIYFGTRAFVTKDLFKEQKDTETKEEETSLVDTSKAVVGTMLNKNDSDYYVIIYNSTSDDAANYSAMVSSYTALKEKNVYTVDLNEGMNKSFYSSEGTNCNTSNISEMKFGDITVLKVKDGKVTSCFENTSKIEKEWKIS